MRPMQTTRRSWALAAGALLLAAPLASCGFDNATDRVYTPAAGTNDRDASVDILNAVIVSAEEGSGTFIATFVNNDQGEAATIEALTSVENGVGNDPDTVTEFPGFSSIDVPARGLVNLASDELEPIEVTGDFKAGDVVSVTVEISGGQPVQINPPVVPPCWEFEGIDGTGECEVAEPEGEH